MVKYFKNKRSVFNQQDILFESAKLEEKKDTLRRGLAEVDISLTFLVLKEKEKKFWGKDIFSRDELSWEGEDLTWMTYRGQDTPRELIFLYP